MRRNLFARISLAGILIQLAVCMPAVAANVKSSTTTKHRVTGVVKDALGRPIKHAALSIQNAAGRVVTHASSNDAGEFSFSASRGTYAIVATNPGFKTATAIVTVSAKGAAPVVVSMEAEAAVSLKVAATRLDKARNSLSPDTGGSKYTFTQQAIQDLPQGNNTPLNQVILQAPGVAQDSLRTAPRAWRPRQSSIPDKRGPAPRGHHGFRPGAESALRPIYKPADRRAAGGIRPAHGGSHRYQDQGRLARQPGRRRFLRRAARDHAAELRIRRIEGQLQLLHDGAIPGHGSRRRAAHVGAYGDSRHQQPGQLLWILLLLH